jgi:preprotein translocase subunit SecE
LAWPGKLAVQNSETVGQRPPETCQVCRNKEIELAEKTMQQNAVIRFYRETVGELRKVSWPTREEATNLTLIVIAVLIFMAVLLGSIDWAGLLGLDWILSLQL